MCLLRDYSPGSLLLGQQKSKGGKVTTPKVTILGPGNMTIPAQGPTNQIAESIPMSERLTIPVSKAVSNDFIFVSIYGLFLNVFLHI